MVFRYVDVNPNGSLRDIAGISNERGNVVGLMPHPEHAVEPGFGPDTDVAMRSGVDGLGFLHERHPAHTRLSLTGLARALRARHRHSGGYHPRVT